jgi:hypothetical protein
MKALKTGFVFFCFLFLFGCTHSVVRGTLKDIPLDGLMTSYVLLGRSDIEIHSPDNSIYCMGTMRATHYSNFSTNCDEEEGSVTFDCNKEVVIISNWTADGCGSGYGNGYAHHGKAFHFIFYPVTQAAVADTHLYLKLKNNRPPRVTCTESH